MFVSFGFSCQTRFSIDAVSFDFLRRPFDFNITSQQGLVRAFMTDGQSLRPAFEDFSIFTMPVEKRQGVEANGIYFWHDFPIEADSLSLAANWEDSLDKVNKKYASLWPRFAALLRSDHPKTLVVSNSQSNLQQFSSDEADFDRKFGLGPDAFLKINQALLDFGARNFKLQFLTRTLSDLERCLRQIDDPCFEAQFVGTLSPPFNTMVAASLVCAHYIDIAQACGSFDGQDKLVKQISDRSALIYRNASGDYVLWASIMAMRDGYLASFAGHNKVFKAVIDSGDLYFSNRTKWIRDPGG